MSEVITCGAAHAQWLSTHMIFHCVEAASRSTTLNVGHTIIKQGEKLFIFVVHFLSYSAAVGSQQVSKVDCVDSWTGFLVQLQTHTHTRTQSLYLHQASSWYMKCNIVSISETGALSHRWGMLKYIWGLKRLLFLPILAPAPWTVL